MNVKYCSPYVLLWPMQERASEFLHKLSIEYVKDELRIPLKISKREEERDSTQV